MSTPSQSGGNLLFRYIPPFPCSRQRYAANGKCEGPVYGLDGVDACEVETDATTLGGEGEEDLGEGVATFGEEGLVFEEEVLGLGLGLEGLAHGLFAF
jgi:hypothetical protein